MTSAPLAAFLALSFGLTWSCWVPAALSGQAAGAGPGRWLLYAGSAGPLIATLLVLAPPRQREARARWRRRLTNLPALVSPAGALAVLLPVLIAQLAQDTYFMAGGIAAPDPGLADALALLPATLLIGAIPAELAWRGYALPTLAWGRDALAPTLLVAAAWGLWQLPLFFFNGTYQAGLDPWSSAGLLYFADLAGQSVLMTSLYLATRCTWAAVLFQGLTVFMGELWQLPVNAEIHRSLWTLLAAGIALLVRPPFGMRPAGK